MDQPKCSQEGCTTQSRNRLRRGLCPTHYTRWLRHGSPNVVKLERVDSDLPASLPWDRVSISSDGCWLWTGSRTSFGYAMLGRCNSMHRVFYRFLVGPIPDRMDLDHLCMVKHCVRPDHLEPVTHGENVRRGWAARRTQAVSA